jgi:Rhodanese-like domain
VRRRAISALAVVRDGQREPMPPPVRADTHGAALSSRADAVTDRVLHERLQDEWWNVAPVRRRFVYRRLRIARITPEELKRRLDAHEPTFILDLRHALEFDVQPEIIPGALRMSPEDLDRRFGEISTNQEIVLYCT